MSDLFWSKVQKSDHCWVWLGRKYRDGYGEFKFDGRSIAAHRMAWALANGRAPGPGKVICHTCDVRGCVNPSHLFEGTQKDNMRDMAGKGRWSRVSQEAAAKSRRSFSPEAVREIRRRAAEGESYKSIADSLGRPYSTVIDAARGYTYGQTP